MIPRAALALAAGLAIALATLGGACKKREEAAPEARPAAIGEPELRRGRDACGAYVEQVCACAKTVPAAVERCKLAKALPDSLQTVVETSAHPDTARQDAVQSADAIRKIIARCIEHTAQLPALGCPAPALGR